jgi:hypothetical protein
VHGITLSHALNEHLQSDSLEVNAITSRIRSLYCMSLFFIVLLHICFRLNVVNRCCAFCLHPILHCVRSANHHQSPHVSANDVVDSNSNNHNNNNVDGDGDGDDDAKLSDDRQRSSNLHHRPFDSIVADVVGNDAVSRSERVRTTLPSSSSSLALTTQKTTTATSCKVSPLPNVTNQRCFYQQ